MIITSKFPGVCAVCHRATAVGDKIDWQRQAPVRHAICDEGQRAAQETARLQNIESSRAAAADVEIPCPAGLEYLPFQKAGISSAVARTSVLLADEMGLGKTIQAIGVINADNSLQNILIICPASLRLNWQRELEKWLVRPTTIEIANSEFPTSQIVIINYDILNKHHAAIHVREWDLVVLDECHYLKNPKAQRSQEVVGKSNRDPAKRKPALQARRKIALTGTPIPNRPIEIQTIAGYLNPSEFGSFFAFAKRYAAAYRSRFGWDLSGASNLAELQEKLRGSIMIRRLKKDVLSELPAKRRQIIELAANGAARAVEAERSAYQAHEETLIALKAAAELAKASDDPAAYTDAVARLKQAALIAFSEMSKARHATALAKIPAIIEHIRAALEDGETKLVAFAHHHDVIAALQAEFPGESVTLTGETAMADRQAAVDRFQNDPAIKVFLGSITAAGVGLTLTAAAHVIFAELDWVPGNVTQAEDRCHRIGQSNSVIIQHLVLESSIDARMARVLVEKQDVQDRALDREPDEEPVVVSSDKEVSATATTSRKQIEEAAASLTPEQITEIHASLRLLAGMCDGAIARDGAGFNKHDAAIGHALAQASSLTPKQAALGQKICRKYRRQLDLSAIPYEEGAESYKETRYD